MPSPIAHTAAAYALFRVVGGHLGGVAQESKWSHRRVFLFVLYLSLVPDLDLIPAILLGDLPGIHNSITNSLLVGWAFALMIGLVVWLIGRASYREWFAVAFVAYATHVVMDYFTAERGVMLAWPITTDRFVAPVRLFFGFHYSEGLISPLHLWTVATELAFAAALVGAVFLTQRLSSALRDKITPTHEIR